METDLWSLDDDEKPAAEAPASEAPAAGPAAIPAAGLAEAPAAAGAAGPAAPGERTERPPQPVREPLVPKLRADQEQDDLGELEDPIELGDWDEPTSRGGSAEAPAPPSAPGAPGAPGAPAKAGDEPEVVAAATAAAPRRPKLSAAERICLLFLAAALLAAGFFVLRYSIGKLPTTTTRELNVSFPQRGELVRVNRAETFWRAPILVGPERDTVRRGTQLIPVIELDVSGNVGALRIFFRDGEGNFVGDSISRELSDEQTLRVAATAGFDDLGMFAAYRTQRGGLWTVEIFEGPSVRAPLQEFTKLFEIPVSTVRR
jgi:hypothetical protein